MRRGLLVVLFMLAGCAVSRTAQPLTNLGVRNATTVSVTVVVNGNTVGEVPPGGAQASIDSAGLPPQPWTVVLRGPSGLELGTMLSGPYAVSTTESASFDWPCGSLFVWTGDTDPSPPDLAVEDSPAPSPACGR